MKRKGCLSKILTIVVVLIALSAVVNIFDGNKTSSSKSSNSSTTQSVETAPSVQTATPTIAAESSAAPSVSPTPTEDPTAALKANAPVVFCFELVNDSDQYLDKYVETTFPISYISSGRIESSSISGSEIEAYCKTDDFYNSRDKYKFATVKGLVSGVSSNDVTIRDAEVLYIGATAPEEYNSALAIYTEQVKQGKIAARADFIESAKKISYDELRRYPDSYRKTPLVMSIYVTEVETDGLLSNGAIRGKYAGGEIIVYDHREIREPRFKAGDSITIYALGDGLTKIKTYVKGSGILGTDLGADVVDEREIPAVDMIYTELDRLDSFGLSSNQSSENDDDYYFNLGRKAAQKFNEIIGSN